jgi:uncharacterized membrane protein
MYVRDCGFQAGAQTAACGNATLPQQKKGTRQMSRRAEQKLPAYSVQGDRCLRRRDAAAAGDAALLQKEKGNLFAR